MEKLQKGIKILDPKNNIKYIIDKFIGEGSFGEVWLAQDENDSSKQIAIKFYIPLDEAGRQLFFDEYKSSADLNHPNLLASLFYGEWERRPYIGMKFCEKGASSKYVGQLSPGLNNEMLIWRFIHDASAGLQFLHEKKDLVHQDIKPDNILIDSDGGFVIMDFGISKKARATLRSQSKRSNSAGAPAYMAPERFTKNPSVIYASDIWSLGASIHELATGELPFNGMGGGMLNAGAEMPVLKDGWSKELNATMQVCLAKNTWDRKRACEIKDYAEWILTGKQGNAPFVMQPVINNPETPTVYIENVHSHSLKKTLVACFASVLFVIAFSYLSKASKEKLADYRYPQFISMVERCQDSIAKGDNANVSTLLESKNLLDTILIYQSNYGEDYPGRYDKYRHLEEILTPKLNEASEVWADAAKRQYDATKDLSSSLRYSRLAVELAETEKALSVYNYLASKTGYMNVLSIDFANSGDDYDYSIPIKASTLRFLTPRISYEGLVKEDKQVQLDVKIIEPNGALSRGANSPTNYTFSHTVTVEKGNNMLQLTGWGGEDPGTYSSGSYIIELWNKGNKIYSKRFKIDE